MSRLYFLIGISGSGKSSYIKSHFIPEVVVSPDDLRRKFTGDVSNHTQEGKVWAVVPKLLQKSLDQYGKAVLDATNVDSGARAGLLNKFPRDIVERIAVVFEIDPEVAKQRVKADIASGKDRSDVPDDVIDKQYEKFKRGYNSIKQQFDKVIDGNKGRSLMKKEDIQKIRKIVNEEMKKILEQDYDSALEKASYQAYQDMYLVPQSNWRLKKSAPMIDSKGREYPGKIGEIHKIQAVEYDFLHTGEVVTECGDETYSVDAEDFRNSFELVGDEEGLQTNNESVGFMQNKDTNFFTKGKVIRFVKDMANLHVSNGDRVILISDEYNDAMGSPSFKIKNLRNGKVYEVETSLLQTAFDKNYIHKLENESVIKEEIKKLVKIKDYFGKNIKGSIERLEEVFLTENKMDIYDSSIDHGKRMVTLIFDGKFDIKTVKDYIKRNYDATDIEVLDYKNPSDYKGLENPGTVDIQINYYHNETPDEPEDAYLDQDFEDRISGDGYEMDENTYLKGKYGDTIKIQTDVPFHLGINLHNESDIKKIDGILQKYGFKFKGKTPGKYWSWHWYYGGKEYPRGDYRLTGDIQRNYIEMEEFSAG